MEVRRKAINIVLSMTSSRNVEDVVLFLKKQLQKTQEQDSEKVKCVIPASIYDAAWLTYIDAFRFPSTDSFSSSLFTSPPSSSRK